MLGEQLDVLRPFAERRQIEGNHPQPVEQVGAEAPLLDLVAQRSVGRRDDPHVDRDRLRAADRKHRAFLQHAQQLRLHLRRELGDLVQEERAAAGQPEVAGSVPDRAGEGALGVAEELALEQRVGERGAVDGDEGSLAPVRGVVDRAGDQLLAGPGLAADQHAGVARGDLLHVPQQLLHPSVAGDDAEALGGSALRAPVRIRVEQEQEADDRALVVERRGAHQDRVVVPLFVGPEDLRAHRLAGRQGFGDGSLLAVTAEHLRGGDAQLRRVPELVGRFVGVGDDVQLGVEHERGARDLAKGSGEDLGGVALGHPSSSG